MNTSDRRKHPRYLAGQEEYAVIKSRRGEEHEQHCQARIHDFTENSLGLEVEEGCISNCAEGDCGLIGSPIEVYMGDQGRFFTGYIKTCHGGRVGVEFPDSIVGNQPHILSQRYPHAIIKELLARHQGDTDKLRSALGIPAVFWEALMTGDRQPNCLGTQALRKIAETLEVPYAHILIKLGVIDVNDIIQAHSALGASDGQCSIENPDTRKHSPSPGNLRLESMGGGDAVMREHA